MKRFGLPAAQQQAAVAHTAIERHFRDAEAGKLGREAIHGNRDEKFVTHRNDGQVEAGQFRDVIGVRAGRIDDVFAPGGAVIGPHADHAAIHIN